MHAPLEAGAPAGTTLGSAAPLATPGKAGAGANSALRGPQLWSMKVSASASRLLSGESACCAAVRPTLSSAKNSLSLFSNA
eukprot:834258-Pyramimonas_sp.AAC.1